MLRDLSGVQPDPPWARQACDALSALALLDPRFHTKLGAGPSPSRETKAGAPVPTSSVASAAPAALVIPTPGDVVECFLHAACAQLPGVSDSVERRLVCLHGECTDVGLGELRAARAKMRQIDSETLNQELLALGHQHIDATNSAARGESSNTALSVVSLRHLSQLLPNCLADAEKRCKASNKTSSLVLAVRQESLGAALAALARAFRVARDVMHSAANASRTSSTPTHSASVTPRHSSQDSTANNNTGAPSHEVASAVAKLDTNTAPLPSQYSLSHSFRVNCAAMTKISSVVGSAKFGASCTFAIVGNSPAGACMFIKPEEDSPNSGFKAPYVDASLVSGDDTGGDALSRLVKTVYVHSQRTNSGERGTSDGDKNDEYDGAAPEANFGLTSEAGKKLTRLREVKALAFLTAEQLHYMAKAMKTQSYDADFEIIRQGDRAETGLSSFFLIQQGAARVFVTPTNNAGEMEGAAMQVRELGPGNYFGEIGLLSSDSVRTATVVAHGPGQVVCWTLSRDEFRNMFGDDTEEIMDTGRKLSYLRSVKSLAHLNETQIFQMAQMMRLETFKEGEAIIEQGEPGEGFYVIQKGCAEVRIANTRTSVLQASASVVESGAAEDATIAVLVEGGASQGDSVAGASADGGRSDNDSGYSSASSDDEIEAMPILLSAEAMNETLKKKTLLVRELGQGDFFGEIALFNDLPRTASVFASRTSSLSCWTITRREFTSIFCEDEDNNSGGATPMVMFTDPGDDFDDEMALVLSRALVDMKLIDLKAVIANSAPAHARARLTRGTLDALDMRETPVGVGMETRDHQRSSSICVRSGERVPSQTEALKRWDIIIVNEGLLYRKTEKVHAKMAQVDGVLETVVEGVTESKKWYEKGDFIMIGTRGGRYPMKAADFASLYEYEWPEEAREPALMQEGFQLFRPTGRVWARPVTAEEIAQVFPAGQFMGKWGGTTDIQAGDFLALTYPYANVLYRIKRDHFPTAYTREEALLEGEVIAARAAVISGKEYEQRTSVSAKLLPEHAPPPESPAKESSGEVPKPEFISSVEGLEHNYLQRDPDHLDGTTLLRSVFDAAEPQSLTLLVVSRFSDLSRFIRENEEIFYEKTARVAIMGGVDLSSLGDDTCPVLLPDNSAANHKKDPDAASFVFSRCQQLGVPLLVLTNVAAYAAPLPTFVCVALPYAIFI